MLKDQNIIFIYPMFYLFIAACSNLDSNEYPDLSEGFGEPREIPQRVVQKNVPSTENSGAEISGNIQNILERFEDQKGLFLLALNKVKSSNSNKRRDWFTAQLEYTKLSKLAEELERSLRGGHPTGEFTSDKAKGQNKEIEIFLQKSMEQLSLFKP